MGRELALRGAQVQGAVMGESVLNPKLLLVGVNHTTAPVEVRERLAIPAARLPDAVRSLAAQPGVQEAMILSTCNRVELLTVAETAEPQQPTLEFFEHYLSIPARDVTPHLYQLQEREAVRHLFRVAASLDSMVVGEPQILGQVKQSWTVAREVGAVRSRLDPLLQRTFSVAKRVRTETQIGSSTVSIASVAAELAGEIFGALDGKTVLLIGAGKMSELAARHLIRSGVKTLLVANRTESRAQAVADALRTPTITTGVIPLPLLAEQGHRADIVITSTGAGQVVTAKTARTWLERRRNRPVFFIDIAVPRDVAPEVNKVEGCFVYDIDDLQQVAARNQAARSEEAQAAEGIVADEVRRYDERETHRSASSAIKALTEAAEQQRQQELARLRATGMSEEQMAAVDRMTRTLTAKLLHPQIAALSGTLKND